MSTETGHFRQQNRRILRMMLLVVVGMIGVSYLSVPLYDWFCRVTGWSGTPGRISTELSEVNTDELSVPYRPFTVRFDANTNPEIPWKFEPVESSMNVQMGQQNLAFYRATNISDASSTGTATFNVTPLKFGQYFVKIDCFCFTEQTLAAGESVDMPVSFYIDPAIHDDPNLEDVEVVTLSYTFFPLKED